MISSIHHHTRICAKTSREISFLERWLDQLPSPKNQIELIDATSSPIRIECQHPFTPIWEQIHESPRNTTFPNGLVPNFLAYIDMIRSNQQIRFDRHLVDVDWTVAELSDQANAAFAMLLGFLVSPLDRPTRDRSPFIMNRRTNDVSSLVP